MFAWGYLTSAVNDAEPTVYRCNGVGGGAAEPEGDEIERHRPYRAWMPSGQRDGPK